MADPIMMDTTQQVRYQISGFFADEAMTIPATVDGPPIAEVIDGDGVTLDVAPDGMSGRIVSIDLAMDAPPHTARIRIRADANKDPNVQHFIELVQDFVVTSIPSPQAVVMGVSFGAPEPK